MKLYVTPRGTWAGSEKDWKDAVKAEGLDPKKLDRKIVEVPVSKAELMEWLTFHNVAPLRPFRAGVAGGQASALVPLSSPTTVPDLDAAFTAAPLRDQLRLASIAIGTADARLDDG